MDSIQLKRMRFLIAFLLTIKHSGGLLLKPHLSLNLTVDVERVKASDIVYTTRQDNSLFPSPSQTSALANDTFASNMELAVINKWRARYLLPNLNWDTGLAEQALTVGQAGVGVNEIHKLIPGKYMGQVITPGQQNSDAATRNGKTAFEISFIGWLCEDPNDPQLQASSNNGVDLCQLQQSILPLTRADDGHHKIIIEDGENWHAVGCAFAANPNVDQQTAQFQGLWTCNFAS